MRVRAMVAAWTLLGWAALVGGAESKPDAGAPRSAGAADVAALPPLDEKPRDAAKGPVAVLNVGQVLQSHPRFRAQAAELKRDTERAEAIFKRERNALLESAKDVEKLPAGAPELAAKKEQLTARQRDLATQIELQQKEFQRREAQLYQTYYQEVVRTVDAYARENSLTVVLRSERGAAGNEPAEVLRNVARPVVWTADAVDITPQIIERIAKSTGAEAKSEAKAAAQPEKDVYYDDSPAPKPRAKKGGKKARAKSETKSGKEKKAEAPAKPAAKDAKPEAKPQTQSETAPKKATVVRIVLKGDYPEGPAAAGLFGDVDDSLASVIRKLDRAAEDKATAAVLLEFEEADFGAGKVHEMRAAIARVRKAGKPVYAALSGADTNLYLVAAACDQVALAPPGMLLVPGVRAEMTFYKGLLDKVGLKYDVLQMGKYKGAGETFTRTEMSPDLRESMKAMVDDSFERLVELVAQDRKLDPAEVRKRIDQGLFTAAGAHKAGLVDRVEYLDEFQEALRKRLGADELNLVSEAKKRSEVDLSGMSGMMKFMQLAMGGGGKEEKSSAGRKIAVVYATGVIVEGESSTSLFGEQALGSTTLVKALRAAAEDPKVLAIVLRIDSPGGSAVASDLVWREVRKIQKPVVASMGDVAASGGYYIAMGCRKIYAEPGTVTGSIGVVGGKLVTGGLYAKLGVTTDVISRGRNSGSLSSTQAFTPEERTAWTALLEETYRQFVDKAAEGRKMPREKLEALAQGRVYTGRMAVANGLVDALGTLQDAVAEAQKAAGVKADEKLELLILPKPKSIFEQLFDEPSITSSKLAAGLPRELLGRVELLRRLTGERVLALLPCEIEMK